MEVFGRFVLHALSSDEKHARVEHAKDMLQLAQSDTTYTKSIVTGDETWCSQYESSHKVAEHSMVEPKEVKPKKVHMQKSRVKTLQTVFCQKVKQ
jgi:hypothetical protein